MLSNASFLKTLDRVGKNPGFFNKTQPSGVFWVLLGFWGFIGFYWVFLGFTKFEYAQPQYQVQLRAKVVISPFSIAVPTSVGAKMVVILTFLATHPNRLGFALIQQEHQCKVSLSINQVSKASMNINVLAIGLVFFD